jgi:DNA invertase Pin-like site-specific DNA recombinase
MKVVIYSRVSTNSQDYKRQTNELMEYSKKMNYSVLEVFEEKISGAKKNYERPDLTRMINFVKENNIDKVLCWELSRIGRDTIEVLKTIQLLNDNCISLYIKNHNIETLNDKCEVSPMSTFLIQILTSVSEMEKTTIRQRIKSGYDAYISKGGVVGRKQGYSKPTELILEENKEVIKLLKQGLTYRQIKKISGKSLNTIQKVKKISGVIVPSAAAKNEEKLKKYNDKINALKIE